MDLNEEVFRQRQTGRGSSFRIGSEQRSPQLGSTHADAPHGILDYLEGRFRGPIVIADSSKDNTLDAYEDFHYNRILAE